ncbi:DUF3068 domain-containing protein [Nonomuraea glycinis]|uniref:DUF3068 domain-containing protein n=1 Tax=Nonomuraea glycinis TaxID=2047744 RepID=A0A918A3M8_9ACTN|nr:DUF3068 domain-containing protein [Nonomuraea glycinis]MCA2175880.1 DUF3068 domain-containing protein [Nonomuraea glycinis]GGP05569.1 hypothetical protein GCM10012278_25630 [Nonomuraea glycinis]
MRRHLPLLLAALGAFLLTLIPLLRLYVSDQVLRTPLEQQSVTRATAESATYLDPATMTIEVGPLVQTRWLIGDVLAGTAERAVWGESVSLTTAEDQRLDYHERRLAFDRRSGEIVNCCGEYLDEDTRVRQTGQAFRWPFQAGRRDYQLFDLRLRRPVSATFDGVELIGEVETYRYVQRTPRQLVPGEEAPLPRRLLGLKGKGYVGVARHAEIRRTFWVEPVSGLPIRTEDQVTETLSTADGSARVTGLDAVFRTSAGDVLAALDIADFYRRWVLLVDTVVPVGGGLLGGGCVVAAIWLVRRRSPAAQDQEQVPGHQLAQAR